MRGIADEKGVALITALFFLVIVSALAAGALMLATVQVQVSGSVARMERVYAAAEACESYVYPLLTSVHYGSGVPAEYPQSAITRDPTLEMDRSKGIVWSSGDPDNLICTALENFTANVDIDKIGTTDTGGGNIDTKSNAYHQSPYGSSEMDVYRITTSARTLVNTGEAVSLCQAVYLKPQ